MMQSGTIKWLKRLCIVVIVFLLLYWLSVTIATALFRHSEQTLDFLAGVESIKHWFILMRLTIYIGIYVTWSWLLKKLKPEITSEIILETRKFLVRFFIVYELIFGVNIIAFLQN